MEEKEMSISIHGTLHGLADFCLMYDAVNRIRCEIPLAEGANARAVSVEIKNPRIEYYVNDLSKTPGNTNIISRRLYIRRECGLEEIK